ncbi:MAG: glycosyltransferase family 4 protein [Chloroflexi bacterium]|nr:glycosyltransferase family 4 protein [Chloroflexota bacterium]
MRILQIVHQYLPEHVGGTELYTQWLTQGLQEQGHTVAVFTRRERTGQGLSIELVDQVPVYAAWAGVMTPTQRYLATFRNAALVNAFGQVLDHFQPDLVHVQHLMGLPTGILDLVQARGIPYIVTLHDYWWICANANLLTNYSDEICDGPVAYLNCTHCMVARSAQAASWLGAPALTGSLIWRARLLRKILQGAEQVIVFSEFVRTWYVQHGLASAKLRLLAPGVEQPPPDLPIRRPEQPVRLLYLGGIARIKGVHVILEALRHLQGDVELWVAGDLTSDPVYSEELRQLATAQVTFLGRLDRQTVWQRLAQVDLLLAPSLWHETYCFVAREAFAAGVPVIASRIGALGELVHHEIDGLLVKPGDHHAWQAALQSVIDDPARLDRWRTAIRQPAHRQAHIAQVIDLYGGLVKTSHV